MVKAAKRELPEAPEADIDALISRLLEEENEDGPIRESVSVPAAPRR